MKIYLINLDRDKDRLDAAHRQLKSMGCDYERVSAVYGKDLTCAEKKEVVSYFRWWCAVGTPPRDGEIGCALSHLKAYQELVHLSEVDPSVKCACVLEDDVVLDSRFAEMLVMVGEWLDKDCPQVILLSNHSIPDTLGDHVSGYCSLPKREFAVLRCHHDSFSEGYVLTVAAAKALIWQNSPLKIFADAWTRWNRIGAIELFHAFPTVCSQNKVGFSSYTALTDATLDVSKMPFSRWVWHKFKRLIGVALDRIIVTTMRR